MVFTTNHYQLIFYFFLLRCGLRGAHGMRDGEVYTTMLYLYLEREKERRRDRKRETERERERQKGRDDTWREYV